jgi:RHS repeat-associated protein
VASTTASPIGPNYSCEAINPSVVLQHRYVSFDGTHEVLQQDFEYATTLSPATSPETGESQFDEWTSKQTTVTTHDLVRGNSYTKTYKYTPSSPASLEPSPAEQWTGVFNVIPWESNVQTTDFNSSLIRDVNETYSFVFMPPTDKKTTLDNGQTSDEQATYASTDFMQRLTDTDEYDFGAATGSAAQPGAPGALLKHTHIDYASFAANPVGGIILDRPSHVIIYDGNGNRVAESDYIYDNASLGSVTAAGHDDFNFPASFNVRGNATSQTRKCFIGTQTCSNAVTTYAYLQTGQIATKTDPNLNVTNYSYKDSFTDTTPSENTNAYLTQITYPLTNNVNHIENFSYGYANGELTISTDQNKNVTNYTYSDPWGRLTESAYPDRGETLIAYNDSVPSVTVSKKLSSSGFGTFVKNVTTTDGVGHVIQTQLTSDPDGTDTTVTAYDGEGLQYTKSNPYRSTSDLTYGTTTYVYDSLGRLKQVTDPDGSTALTTYSGNCMTASDEAGATRETCTDGLGHLTTAIEDPSGLDYQTLYSYDALGDLTSVLQNGSRQRTYVYNSLGQLTSSANPESNTSPPPAQSIVPTTYRYDGNGNLTYKTSPAQNQGGTSTVTLTYCYDALNRMTAKAYTQQTCVSGSVPTPVATYSYDQATNNGLSISNGIGRRTGMTDAGGTEAWSYDVMGRVLTDQRTTNSVTKSTNYVYLPYVDGSLYSLTYPSGRLITYQVGGAERVLSASDSTITYASGAHYTPWGALTSVQNGGVLNSTDLYNNRLQPCWLYTTTSSALVTTTACTAADSTPGNLRDFKIAYSASHNNGNVTGVTNDRDTTRSQAFTYDSLNRISTAATTSTDSTSPTNCWGEQYAYDPWGSLLSISFPSASYTGCQQESGFAYTMTAQNRISGDTYDSAGNLLVLQPGSSYSYNAENQLSQASNPSPTSYIYDGDGNRIEKQVASSTTKIYWYGNGEVLDETDGSGSVSNSSFFEYIFAGGRRIARRDSAGNGLYYFSDQLGTSRTIAEVVSGGTTAALCYDADFYAFGGERLPVVSNCSQSYKFTGKERDSESGLDNFGARYNSSQFGRFMTPDSPSYSNHKNPQSWNLYAYSLNNPVTFRDADGHKIDCANNVQQCQQDAANSTGNAQAAARVTTETTKHGWWIFKWSETSIKITGDINSFRALSPNASKLADLVTSDKTITVNYSDAKPGTWTENGEVLHGGSTSRTPSQGWDPTAWIDPNRTPGAVYDQDAVDQGIPQANTGEEFGHEVLGHIWGEMFGGAPAGTRGNMRDSIIGENAVRALDPTRGQKGLESHHNYQEATPDPPKPQQ